MDVTMITTHVDFRTIYITLDSDTVATPFLSLQSRQTVVLSVRPSLPLRLLSSFLVLVVLFSRNTDYLLSLPSPL